jgi:hypothetical protein
MQFSKWYFGARCVVCAVLGMAMALAGVDVTTRRGMAVFIVLGLLAVVDGVHEVCATRRAYQKGCADITKWVLDTRKLNDRKHK